MLDSSTSEDVMMSETLLSIEESVRTKTREGEAVSGVSVDTLLVGTKIIDVELGNIDAVISISELVERLGVVEELDDSSSGKIGVGDDAGAELDPAWTMITMLLSEIV